MDLIVFLLTMKKGFRVKHFKINCEFSKMLLGRIVGRESSFKFFQSRK